MEEQKLRWAQRHPNAASIFFGLALLVVVFAVLTVLVAIGTRRETTKAVAEFERIRNTPVAGVRDPLEERWQRSKKLARFHRHNSQYLNIDLDDRFVWSDPDSDFYRSLGEVEESAFRYLELCDVVEMQRACREAHFKQSIFSAAMRLSPTIRSRHGGVMDEEIYLFLCMPDLDDHKFERLWIPVYTRQLVPWAIEKMEYGLPSFIADMDQYPTLCHIYEGVLDEILPEELKGHFNVTVPPRRDYIEKRLKWNRDEATVKQDERLVREEAAQSWRELKRDEPENVRHAAQARRDCVATLRALADPVEWYYRNW